jgi:hypothetical protein
VALAGKLVAVGLWEVDGDGWRVHDFHDHNPTAAEVKARRSDLSAKRAEAGKRGGIRSGQVRGGEANGKQTGSKAQANDEAFAEAKRSPVPSRPVPSRPGHEEGEINPPAREARAASPVPPPQSPEDAPCGPADGVTGADIEEALHRATKGALRFSAAPSTQTAAIVGYLRRAGLTRDELPHLADVVAHPGELWEWAKVRQGTVAWLAGKADAATREHDCARLQEALGEARRRHARAVTEAAEVARRAALRAEAESRTPLTDAEREAMRAAFRDRLAQRSTTP